MVQVYSCEYNQSCDILYRVLPGISIIIHPVTVKLYTIVCLSADIFIIIIIVAIVNFTVYNQLYYIPGTFLLCCRAMIAMAVATTAVHIPLVAFLFAILVVCSCT